MLVLKPKSLNYLRSTSVIVNRDSANLLGSIITKSHVQIMVVQEELPLRK